jgi:hypothetical protein
VDLSGVDRGAARRVCISPRRVVTRMRAVEDGDAAQNVAWSQRVIRVIWGHLFRVRRQTTFKTEAINSRQVTQRS